MGFALISILFPLPSPLSLSLWLSKSSSLSSWFLCPPPTWPTWGGSGPLDTCVRATAHGVGLKFWHLHNHWGSPQVGNMVGAFLPLSLVRAVIFGLVILVPYLVICLCYIHIVCKLRNSRQHQHGSSYIPDICHFSTLTHFYRQICLSSHLCLAGRHFQRLP